MQGSEQRRKRKRNRRAIEVRRALEHFIIDCVAVWMERNVKLVSMAALSAHRLCRNIQNVTVLLDEYVNGLGKMFSALKQYVPRQTRAAACKDIIKRLLVCQQGYTFHNFRSLLQTLDRFRYRLSIFLAYMASIEPDDISVSPYTPKRTHTHTHTQTSGSSESNVNSGTMNMCIFILRQI